MKAPTEFAGFGNKLVRRSIAGHLRGGIEYDWAPEGLVVTLRMNKLCLSE